MNATMIRVVYFSVGFICSFSRLIEGDLANYLEWFSKPLLMPLLFLYVKSYIKNHNILALGILFAWFGDLFLMVAGNEFLLFLLGLVSFLVMQIMYIILYLSASDRTVALSKGTFLSYLPFVALGIYFYYLMYPSLDFILTFAVGIYAAALVSMNIAAQSRRNRTRSISYSLVSLGALLFMISDMIIGYSKFVSSFSYSGFLIMITYFIGQFLIMEGIIRCSTMQNKK